MKITNKELKEIWKKAYHDDDYSKGYRSGVLDILDHLIEQEEEEKAIQISDQIIEDAVTGKLDELSGAHDG